MFRKRPFSSVIDLVYGMNAVLFKSKDPFFWSPVWQETIPCCFFRDGPQLASFWINDWNYEFLFNLKYDNSHLRETLRSFCVQQG